MPRAAGLSFALLLLLSCGAKPPAGSVHGFLLVSIDTLRADHVGCYGYPRDTTPRLDRLAREGTFVREAVATSPWTLPSHMSMLTGLLPETHGVFVHLKQLDPERPYLPEMLQRHGWQTAAFVSGPFVDGAFGFARGFDTYRNHWQTSAQLGRKIEWTEAVAESEHQKFEADLLASHRDRTGPEVTGEAIEWLARHGERPFFLFVHLWEPHYDYLPPPPYNRKFVDPAYRGGLSMDGFITNDAIGPEMARHDLDYLISQYDGEIAFTDHLVGRLLDRLEALGLAARTLVVVTSDHGEEFFEHGAKGHQRTLFEESIRVPLILRGPGVPTVPDGLDRQASLIDIAPTLASAARIAADPEMMGRDLLASPRSELGRAQVPPLVEPPPALPPRPAPFAVSQLSPFYGCRLYGLRLPGWKVVLGCQGLGGVYDLANDPDELRPLPEDQPIAALLLERARQMAAVERARQAMLEEAGVPPVILSEDVMRELRSLGYLQ